MASPVDFLLGKAEKSKSAAPVAAQASDDIREVSDPTYLRSAGVRTYGSALGHGASQDFEDELNRIVKSYQTGQ